MGLEVESDSDKKCSADLSPNTVLPSLRQCSSLEKGKPRRIPSRKDGRLSVKDEFREISFSRYRSASCKNFSSRPVGLEGNVELKRGSIYQSSRKVSRMKEMGTAGERRKIEISRGSDSSFSFRIFDSLCNLDEENSQDRSAGLSLNSKVNSSSVSKDYTEPSSSDGYIEFCLDSESKEMGSAKTIKRDSMGTCRNDTVACSSENVNKLLDRDAVNLLNKSLSAKIDISRSPCISENDQCSKASHTPIRKVFDPFIKSKSMRNPSSCASESGEVKTQSTEETRRNRTYMKSLLQDFSSTSESTEVDSQFEKKETDRSAVSSSPVHLHGFLKVEFKQGVPFFEFSLNFPEDVFVAKAWKTDSAFKWMYTFHSVDGRKKSNASGWALHDNCRSSLLVGQMQVSCYLSSELRDGIFDNSVVTEFVLYDTVRARHSTAALESCGSTPDTVKSPESSPGLTGETFKLDDASHTVKPRIQQKHASDIVDCDNCKWTLTDLHPNLETAAIAMQIPLNKRENLNHRRGGKINAKMNQSQLNHWKDSSDDRSPEQVQVVIPAGTHGLPTSESRGPSPLLERWRSGGGCDCGGWDMGCPLIVLGNPCIQYVQGQSIVDHKKPFELFLQGAKDRTPALIITSVKDGQFAVDFHARLSTLQAFSICVAILHGTEVCSAAMQGKNRELSQSGTMRVPIDEDVRFLIDAITAEDKKKALKSGKERLASYMINPPFSPIARV